MKKSGFKTLILAIFVFIIYPALMILLILMHRKYISKVPMFGFHTGVELLERGAIYYFYLLVIHLPLFFFYQKLVAKIELLNFRTALCFGICLGLCVFFLLTLPINGHLALVPLFCVILSFFYVFKYGIFLFENYFSIFSLKIFAHIVFIILGFCLALCYIIFCLIYQLYVFDDYDFLGKNFGIPSYKQGLNFLF